MKKRLIQIMGIFLCLQSFYMTAGAEEIPIDEPEKIEIVDTIPIEPDVITLLKEEVRYTQHWDEGCYDDTIQLSQSDAEVLLKIAWSEGGNQGIQGQLRIMQTVWNRVLSDDFPNTIEGVVLQGGQFSSVTNKSYFRATPTWETHIALAEFEKNKSHDDNLIGFETVDNGSVLLSYFDFYEVYGDHIFYKLKD